MSAPVNLPKTNFKLKQNFSKSEEEILPDWKELYSKLENKFMTDDLDNRFILHSGPPYANGNIHIGHAVNTVLKDAINRFKSLNGHNLGFVPGWDCHGLPIEWKVEEKYNKEGKDKSNIIQFRKDCREFATKWINVQREEFKRLGVLANWDAPYTTMNFNSEAEILNQLYGFVKNGSVYQDFKPIMWSPIEETSLAEAEVEYKNVTTKSTWVKFKVTQGPLTGANIVVWTTTPWTLMANEAVAFNPNIEYYMVKCDKEIYIIAKNRLRSFLQLTELKVDVKIKVDEKIIHVNNDKVNELVSNEVSEEDMYLQDMFFRIDTENLVGTICKHPLLEKEIPLLDAEYVTDTDGSGFVHIAPGHGDEDFKVGKKFKLPIKSSINGKGHFHEDIPLVGGMFYKKGNDVIIENLKENLITTEDIVHQYPHSWRSGKPVVFMVTPQWFVRLNKEKLAEGIETVQWFPAESKNRISAMTDSRPSWCISRQRLWGVPIMLFVDKNGRILSDEKLLNACVELTKEKGCDWWYDVNSRNLMLAKHEHDYEKYTPVMDILDVWFDSGCTHSFVVRNVHERKADLYVEGTDQHRGWFQSSLICSMENYNEPPYKQVLTHGFVLAETGLKMSKSSGNVVAPQDVIAKHGADVLRLWALGANYFEDLKCGQNAIKTANDLYEKIRNTFRFLLGNLNGHNVYDFESDYKSYPELEKYILNTLIEKEREIIAYMNVYDFSNAITQLKQLCTNTLSSYYFDIRKDSLYCDDINSPRRKAVINTFKIILHKLLRLFTPIIPFCVNEICNELKIQNTQQGTFQDILVSFTDDYEALKEQFETVNNVRKVVTAALEIERQHKRIGSSLEAFPAVLVTDEIFKKLASINDLPDIFIVSNISLENYEDRGFSLEDYPNIRVVVDEKNIRNGKKCVRCWRYFSDDSDETECPRCENIS